MLHVLSVIDLQRLDLCMISIIELAIDFQQCHLNINISFITILQQVKSTIQTHD